MYCYVCLMFGGTDIDWCINGVFDLENFNKKAYKHQSTKHHLLNKEKFLLLGVRQIENKEVGYVHMLKHNEQVSSNRMVLKRVIQAIMYLCIQELAFGENVDQYGNNEIDNYTDVLNLLSQNELLIRDYLKSSIAFKLTISDIQRDLFEVISSIVKEKIISELKQSTFISIQVDNNIDVASHKQMSIIFRYLIKSQVIERFIGFYDFPKSKNNTCNNKYLSNLIRQVLKDWNVEGIQVISQSYNGSISLIDNNNLSLPSLVREFCPYALCTYCYAHNLNSTLLYACKNVKQIRVFLGHITCFNNFFSKSTKTRDLIKMGHKFANNPCHIISVLVEKFSEILKILNEIINDDNSQWDYDSLNSAQVLFNYMNDLKFVFMLCVYKTCFKHVDPHFKHFETFLKNVQECIKNIKFAIANIIDLNNDIFVENCLTESLNLNKNLKFDEEDRIELKLLTFEFLRTLTDQMNERFLDLTNLQFIDLLNEEKFLDFDKGFPIEYLHSLLKIYPFFNQEQLQNELSNIYSDIKKSLTPFQLLKHLVANGLDGVYEEVTKLLNLLLTCQILPTDDEFVAHITLNRVKSYLSNKRIVYRSFCLDLLAIEKDLARDLSSDHIFIDNIIDLYAQKTNRQFDLIYKVI